MIFGKFPPNMFIPYPTFIVLRLNVHPIWLFHTLPLLGTLEYALLDMARIKVLKLVLFKSPIKAVYLVL